MDDMDMPIEWQEGIDNIIGSWQGCHISSELLARAEAPR